MKRLLTILAFLLLAAPAMAGEPVIATEHSVAGASAVVFPGTSTITLEDPWTQLARMSGPMLGSGGSAAAGYTCGGGTSYTLCEDFEGSVDCSDLETDTNCSVSWTGLNTPTVDFTFTTSPLEGTNSLHVDSDSSVEGVYSSFTIAGNSYAYLLFSVVTDGLGSGSATPVAGLFDASGNNLCTASLYNDGAGPPAHIYFRADSHATSTTVCSSDCLNLKASTSKYHLWIEHVKGGTSTCTIYACLDSGGTCDKTLQASDSHTHNTDAGRIYLETYSGRSDPIKYDKIRISTSAIGSNPN